MGEVQLFAGPFFGVGVAGSFGAKKSPIETAFRWLEATGACVRIGAGWRWNGDRLRVGEADVFTTDDGEAIVGFDDFDTFCLDTCSRAIHGKSVLGDRLSLCVETL